MKKLKLNLGYYTLLDDEDFQKYSSVKWYVKFDGEHRRYVHRMEKGNHYTLHRLILNVKSNEYVDHINGNGLDNRKANLRICTKSENARNSLKRNRTKSKYKGVSKITPKPKNRSSKRWIAYIRGENSKHIYLGSFYTEKEAALAYNEAAKKYHGKFANLNKVHK